MDGEGCIGDVCNCPGGVIEFEYAPFLSIDIAESAAADCTDGSGIRIPERNKKKNTHKNEYIFQ